MQAKAGVTMRYNGPTAAVRDQFHQGTNRRAYEMLGAHPVTQDGQEMWHFAVWAPNARAVSLIGEFNQWDREKRPCRRSTTVHGKCGCPREPST